MCTGHAEKGSGENKSMSWRLAALSLLSVSLIAGLTFLTNHYLCLKVLCLSGTLMFPEVRAHTYMSVHMYEYTCVYVCVGALYNLWSQKDIYWKTYLTFLALPVGV